MVWNIVLLVAGLTLLGVAGEALVKGASQIARRFGIPALIVGLTVVAFGTSMPEIAVTMSAGGTGHDEIAIANVVGSCTMNLLIVLGLAAVARPMRVARNVISNEAPIMILVMALFVLLASHRRIEAWMGLALIGGLVAYIGYTIVVARRQTQFRAEFESGLQAGPLPTSCVLVLIGLIGLGFGANLVVEGAVGIATALGISERLIGLTIVAFGTSLPEVATCVVAARRNQPDIAIGNVIGSNIFNILAVVGVTASVFPLDVSDTTFFFDAPVMMLSGLIVIPILRTGRRISRGEGGFLLILYGVYLSCMLLGVQR